MSVPLGSALCKLPNFNRRAPRHLPGGAGELIDGEGFALQVVGHDDEVVGLVAAVEDVIGELGHAHEASEY